MTETPRTPWTISSLTGTDPLLYAVTRKDERLFGGIDVKVDKDGSIRTFATPAEAQDEADRLNAPILAPPDRTRDLMVLAKEAVRVLSAQDTVPLDNRLHLAARLAALLRDMEGRG